jgi:hypothetical protein
MRAVYFLWVIGNDSISMAGDAYPCNDSERRFAKMSRNQGDRFPSSIFVGWIFEGGQRGFDAKDADTEIRCVFGL